MPQDRLRSPRGSHGRRLTSLTDFEFRVWDQYQLSSDDFGVMRCSAIGIQADNDALAERPTADVQTALERLIEVELVAAFEHQGRRYVCQLDWQAFQKVEYPRASDLPKPPADVLTRCDVLTRRLFSKHPGGWKRGRQRVESTTHQSPEGLPKVSGGTSEGSPTVPGTQPEGTPEEIPNIWPKPLAVSNSNSRQQEPLVDTPVRSSVPPFSGKEPPLTMGFRQLKVWRFMLDSWIEQLGTLAYDFDVERWLFSIDGTLTGVMPRNGKDWFEILDKLFQAEVRRRGLPSAAQAVATATALRRHGCRHDPPCADDIEHTRRDMADRKQVPA